MHYIGVDSVEIVKDRISYRVKMVDMEYQKKMWSEGTLNRFMVY